MWDNFLQVIGFVSSILTVLGFFLGFFSPSFRNFLAFVIRSILRLEVEEIFRNRDAAQDDLALEIEQAKTLRVISSRLTDFHSSDSLAELLRQVESRGLKVRVLLPDPDPGPYQFNWTDHRDQECGRFDKSMGHGELAEQIRGTMGHLRVPIRNGQLEVLTMNYPHLARIVITNRCAFFTPYTDDRHGSKCAVFKHLAGTTMYLWLERCFEHFWVAAQWRKENPIPEVAPPLVSAANRVKALIFDCDGTLADSMEMHYQALKHVLAPVGVHIESDQFHSRGGKPTVQIIKEILHEMGQELSHEQIAQLAMAKEAHFIANIDQLKPIPWVVEIAKQNRGKRRMAIASGAAREVLEKQLSQIGLERCFEIQVAAEDVQKPKPAPDPFLVAAERLNVAPGECLVYEDSDNGIEAAHQAGMNWIDIRGLTGIGGRAALPPRH